MLLNQWKQFTEEQVRSAYPLDQVETTFAGELIEEGDVHQAFSSFNPFTWEKFITKEELKDNAVIVEDSKFDFSLVTDCYFLGDVYFIATSGVSSHTDDQFSQYAYHLVLINTGLIAKGVNQENDFEPQEPGTIIILNNWEWHHCIKDSRSGISEEPIWVSICFDSDDEVPQEVVTKIFEEFLKDETSSVRQ